VPFKASFFANNKNLAGVDFEGWKKATAEAGNPFDTKSTLITAPPKNRIVTIANSYDPTRTYIALYNWEKLENINLDVSGFVPAKSAYKIYDADAEKPFSSPLVSDSSPQTTIPMTQKEFKVLVLIR
jgi:hypothetical protein